MYVPFWCFILILVPVLHFWLEPLTELMAIFSKYRAERAEQKRLEEQQAMRIRDDGLTPMQVLNRLDYRYSVSCDPNEKRNPLGLPYKLFPDKPEEHPI